MANRATGNSAPGLPGVLVALVARSPLLTVISAHRAATAKRLGIEVHSGSFRTVVEDNVVDHGLSIVSGNCAVRRSADTWQASSLTSAV